MPGVVNATGLSNQHDDIQLSVVRRMLDEGAKGFRGGINAGKYASICKVLKATATRDLQYLNPIEALLVSGGGRSTSYQVNFLTVGIDGIYLTCLIPFHNFIRTNSINDMSRFRNKRKLLFPSSIGLLGSDLS